MQNLNETNPYCYGIPALLDAYANAVKRVGLSGMMSEVHYSSIVHVFVVLRKLMDLIGWSAGPTNFAPVILHAAQVARQSQSRLTYCIA